MAETEKYPHVTYFLNGGKEDAYPGEDRIMVPSPKVATYDLQPEMSAYALTDKAVDAIASGKYDLIVLNYANPDMVGHTGVLPAAIKAVEVVDAGIGRLAKAIHDAGGAMLITSDHGNCELMRDPDTGGPHTVPHDQSGAGDSRGERRRVIGWTAFGYRPDVARTDATATARRNDRCFAIAPRGTRRDCLNVQIRSCHRRLAGTLFV